MDNVLSALNRIPCADLTHDEWVRVGMALKAEGYDLNVWDDWSSQDAGRYHPGECARRWNEGIFNTSSRNTLLSSLMPI